MNRASVARSLLTLGVTLLACLLAAPAVQSQPSLVTSYKTYLAGENIVAFFAGGPGNKKDWVGIYPEGEVPDGDPGSTRWFYVDNTGDGNTGLTEGMVTFAGGLNLAGTWTAHFLLNDGYSLLASTTFTVVDPSTPLARPGKRIYAPGETIEITFASGPGNAKDWIGIYPEGVVPDGDPASSLWAYVDGTQDGTTGLAEGKVAFANGLSQTGNYVAYLLLDDGYDILASEPFQVAPPAGDKPRVLTAAPANGAQNVSPRIEIRVGITNGASMVVPGSVKLELDGAVVAHQFAEQNKLVTISYTDTSKLWASESAHGFKLSFTDNSVPPKPFTVENTFTVAKYQNIVLPPPLYFENFDAVPEGQLPAGWTEKSFTVISNEEFDFGNLDSATYATWTVVDASRFTGSFVTYSNPENPDAWEADYQRVLTPNPANVVDGKLFEEPLAKGRFLFGDSGYRNGGAQVLYASTPDYDLTGKQNVHVSFKSLWEQNQDSLAALEYSIDSGQHWLPVAYLIDAADLQRDDQNNLDAVATLTTEYGDVARYVDPDSGETIGGTYGAFIGAPISAELAPFIQGRVDDDPAESKRVELYRLPQADNQARVRLRFAHAGTDSWYWGIDDFGLYSIGAVVAPPTLSISRTGNDVKISWPADVTGFALEAADDVAASSWTPVPGVAGNSVTIQTTETRRVFRLRGL